jgi:hypothetical protein
VCGPNKSLHTIFTLQKKIPLLFEIYLQMHSAAFLLYSGVHITSSVSREEEKGAGSWFSKCKITELVVSLTPMSFVL